MPILSCQDLLAALDQAEAAGDHLTAIRLIEQIYAAFDIGESDLLDAD